MIPKILCIDDQIDNIRKFVEHSIDEALKESVIFKFAKPDVEFFDDIDEGKIVRFEPDLIIQDLDLGHDDYDGLKIKEIIDTNSVLFNTKFMMLTGVGVELEHYKKALGAGCLGYAIKGEDEDSGEINNLIKELRKFIKILENERIIRLVGNFYSVDHIQKFFSSEENVENIINPKYVSRAILFCDIANSSEYIKTLSDTKKTIFFRHLFNWWSEIIIKENKGWIDKFIGDEVNAYFGNNFNSEPSLNEIQENCIAAIDAALSIRDSFHDFFENLLTLDQPIDNEDYKNFPLGVKIIVHNDNVLLGIFGAHKFCDLSILTDPLIKVSRFMRYDSFINKYKFRERSLIEKYLEDVEVSVKAKLIRSGLICITREVYNAINSLDIYDIDDSSVNINNCKDVPPTEIWIVRKRIVDEK